MSFMKFELAALAKAFPAEKANLEDDFDIEELEAIDNVGVLRGNPHIYLGKIKNLPIFATKNSSLII